MQFGIFTQYFPYPVEETARRIRRLDFDAVQLDLEFTDWRFEPEATTPAECRRVRDAMHREGLAVAAIAGYVNLVASDPEKRRRNLNRLRAVLARARDLGSPLVATESGSRHPQDDWAPHPENADPAVFDALVETVAELATFAHEAGAVLLIEPTVGNVVDTPTKARALLDRLGGGAAALVADPANLVDGANIAQADRVVEESFALLAGRVRLAHAKDFRRLRGEARERHHHASDPALYGGVEYPAPGLGELDYRRYLAWLAVARPEVPVIVEHTAEADAGRALAFLRRQAEAAHRGRAPR
jgi:sugar phosphate isomerase/epimerase